MSYQRPTNPTPLTRVQKVDLLRQYFDHYKSAAQQSPGALNAKLSRDAFRDLLSAVGEILLVRSAALPHQPGPVSQFLDANPLPPSMTELLTPEFRSFCLALNALKQWVVAEQIATDRYLLGAVARDLCREAGLECLVTGAALNENVELHHPVRDGRPPIPLSKSGHARLEGQLSVAESSATGDPIERQLLALRRAANKSWAHLRRGCEDLAGLAVSHSTKGMRANARAFAHKAVSITGLSAERLLEWMDEHGIAVRPLATGDRS